MPNSNFDQPTLGNVGSPQPALEVKNTGAGPAIAASAAQGDGVNVRANGPNAVAVKAVGAQIGVQGSSETGNGVLGQSDTAAGIFGGSGDSDGVHGVTKGRAGASGVVGESFEAGSAGVTARSEQGRGLVASSKDDLGIRAESELENGVEGHARQAGRAGVWGLNVGRGGIGVVGLSQIDRDIDAKGESQLSIGVFGEARDGGTGVRGKAAEGDGVIGETTSANHSGVFGTNEEKHGHGVSGIAADGVGVFASSSGAADAALVAEHRSGGDAVYAMASAGEPHAAVRGRNEGEGYGVLGSSAEGSGMMGVSGGELLASIIGSGGATGVGAISVNGPGVGAIGIDNPGVFSLGTPAVIGIGGLAALGTTQEPAISAIGNVVILGDLKMIGALSVTGPKAFRIDHPLDPKRRYLNHAAVESSELKTVYDGVVALDRDGRATVELPDWFSALNGDLRYQLTPIGTAAPSLHVASESDGKSLDIAGGEAGMRVSWQVTGVRRDLSAQAARFTVEEEKSEQEAGRYLEPHLFGANTSQSLHAQLLEQADDARAKAERMTEAFRKVSDA
jgi:hypothetical protein